MSQTAQLLGRTVWTNPTDKTVRFRIRKGKKIIRNRQVLSSGFEYERRRETPRMDLPEPFRTFDVDIVIPPGESVELDSAHDSIMQVYDESGRIVSGRCPQLIKNGERREMHPSLDPTATRAKEADEATDRALKQKKAAEETLLIAEKRRQEAVEEHKCIEERAAKEAAKEAAKKKKAEDAKAAKATKEHEAKHEVHSGVSVDMRKGKDDEDKWP